MKILDLSVDMTIAEVRTMIADNVQTAIDPMCFRLDIIETVLREDGDDDGDDAEDEDSINSSIVRACNNKHCCKLKKSEASANSSPPKGNSIKN